MTTILIYLIAVVISYLIGSIPTAYIMGRLRKGIDIRQVGSRNMGTMNIMYQVGFWEGILVLAIDIGKGALAVYIAQLLAGYSSPVCLLCGIVVVIGHAFPVFLKFRGGKGGATCIGVLVRLIPFASLLYLGAFLVLLAITRFATLSYSIAFIVFPLVAWLYYNDMTLIIYSIAILIIPGLLYIPRIKEMYAKGGNWKRVFVRKNLKDRL
jgi:glycerol-3-phosphate acyltransferase PlsY